MRFPGYAGRVLRVDLTLETVEKQDLEPDVLRRWVGASGLAAKLIYDEVPAGVDAFDPANKIAIMTGPLTGTKAISTPRYTIASKSPLNGYYAASSASGTFGTHLKLAGYDGIVIEGEAKEPVYLYVSEGRVQLRPASHVWGAKVRDTMLVLQEEAPGKAVIATIGPAGENRVRYASVMSGWRAHGRSGLGAVFGAKRLKAVIVQASDGAVDVSDPAGPTAFSRDVGKRAVDKGSVAYYRDLGTAGHVSAMNELGILPTHNSQSGTFAGADRISGTRMSEDVVVLSRACNGLCPLQCEKLSLVKSGVHAGAFCRGPEYETLFALGSQCGNDDLGALVAAAEACDNYGLDTMSTGNSIAFAMELSQRGLLPRDLWPEPLQFGDADAMLRLIHQITFRTGLGDLLAEGTRRAAERLNGKATAYALHVKGVELPAYDPRGVTGMALAYATGFRGADHLRAWTIAKEIFAPGSDRYTQDGKPGIVKEMQDFRSAVDAAGLCVFLAKDIVTDELTGLLNTVTGFDMSTEELLTVGERIWNQERLLAAREGIGRADDTLPDRLLDEPLPDGPAEGHTVGRERLSEMLSEYYALRGWDQESGHPKPETLERLGL
jgi:aldehyde:ferredoxin oxidoreductase